MARSKVYPDFFAPYLPRLNSQKLMLPRTFLESMNVIPERVTLKDPIGRSWEVGVRKTYCGVYFMNGWEAFIKEISIKEGEFIVFKYNGDSSFGFHVYEHSGCEKMYVEPCRAKSEEEEDCDETGGDEDDDEEDDDDDDEDDDEEDDGDEDYVVDEREDYDNNDLDSDEEEEREEKDKETYQEGRSKKGTSAGTKPVVEPDLDVENYVHYRNPYFVTKGHISKRPHLFVPSRTIKNYKLNLHPGKKMILREQTPSGREWKEEVITWRDGRIMITGWHEFCKWNKVTQDDRCICEFTSVNGNVIDVHIVRSEVATN